MRKAWDHFRHLGLGQSKVARVRKKLDIENVRTAKSVSLVLIIIVAVLLVFYTVFDNNAVRNGICLGAGLFLILIYYACGKFLRQIDSYSAWWADRLLDGLSLVCLLVAIYLGTFAVGDALAVAPVWMFFFIMLAFDRFPAQNLGVVCVAGVIFIVCSYLTKGAHNFQYDIMHCLTSLIGSIGLSWFKTRTKVESILAFEQLEKANLSILGTVEEQEKEALVLRQRASSDELTGLFNKTMMENEVRGRLLGACLTDRFALVCMDIDNFKSINDTKGHLFGDYVLKAVGRCFGEQLSEADYGGRFGGDEFVLFFGTVSSAEEIQERITGMIETCGRTCILENSVDYPISLSAGVSVYPDDGRTYEDLFMMADQALYRSKRTGKGRCSTAASMK